MTKEQKQALIDEIVIQALRDDVRHWQQRAEAAEAKMAEMEQQEPVAYVHPAYLQAGALGFDASVGRLAPAQIPLFTRPTPAADLAELVPGEMFMSDTVKANLPTEWMDGFNACRADILRKIEEVRVSSFNQTPKQTVHPQ